MFLVRHGESVANVDPSILTKMADHVIPLSEQGRCQAEAVGQFLADALAADNRARVLVSPYKRARDTAELLVAKAPGAFLDMHEMIYLGEQQFGLFEGLSLADIRETFPLENAHFEKSIAFGGRFYARMPLGESRFDVVSRVARVIDRIIFDEHYYGIKDFVLVAHGTTLRAFAMAWLERTPEWFEQLPNPQNCSVRLLDGLEDRGYIFEGFARQRGGAGDATDKEQDLVAAVSQQPEAAPTVSRQALEQRLTALETELDRIRRQLKEIE